MKTFATNRKVNKTAIYSHAIISHWKEQHTTFYHQLSKLCGVSFSAVCKFTFAAGGLRCTVRGPCRRFTPAHTGGCSHAEQVDGVRLQALKQIFSAVLRYLHRGDTAVCRCTIGQSVCRQPTAAHLGRQWLPAHLNICGAVADQT